MNLISIKSTIESAKKNVQKRLPLPGRMRALVIESPGKTVIEETMLPEIGNEEILVRMVGCGLCASDLAVWEGRKWFNYPMEPGAPGHEGYGTVAALGNMVTGFSIGDSVSIISNHALAEYDKANMSNVIKIPFIKDMMSFPFEPLVNAVHIVNQCKLNIQDKVVIIGTGYLACLLIKLLKSRGLKVFAISTRESSLEFAREAGADYLINFESINSTSQKIYNIAPEGVTVLIEVTGMISSIDLAAKIISKGGQFIIAGCHQNRYSYYNIQKLNWEDIDVRDEYERDERKNINGIKEAIELTEKGIFQPQKFITHSFNLAHIDTAFSFLRDRPQAFQKAVISIL